MSLDVYLVGPDKTTVTCTCDRCGQDHHRIEYDWQYSANITHNLGKMAAEAGIYEHLWRPDDIGVTRAKQLIEPLRAGLALLKSDRARFEVFNAPNGWGTYDPFVAFVEKYLAACEECPDATVSVSR